MRIKLSFLGIFLHLLSKFSFAQSSGYPKISGYFNIAHTIVTFDKDRTTFSFSKNYTVGFPFGINIFKNDKLGFGFEIAPYLKAESGVSKVSNVSFNPSLLLKLKDDYIFLTRVVFETSGQYGLTPIIGKTIHKAKTINYNASIPFPLRLGNNKPPSIGLGLQLGISF